MKHLKLILLLGLFAIVGACKKSGSSGPTKMELLTSSTWKYESGGIDANKDGFVDTSIPPGYILPCTTDNTLTFKNDGTGTVDEGASKCDVADPQTYPFTWTFKNNETIINTPATFFGITGDVTIKSLSATKLELLKEINIGAPTTVNVIFTFKH